MIESVNQLTSLLNENARILAPTSSNTIPSLVNILSPMRRSQYQIEQWLDTGTDGFRFLFQYDITDSKTLLQPMNHFVHTLEQRGEPCTLRRLKAAYLIENPDATLDDLPSDFDSHLTFLPDTDLVWLRNEQKTAKPLADRVEETTLKLLQGQNRWERDHLEEEIFSNFTGLLSPEPELVNVTITAYTEKADEDTFILRPEDTAKTRRQELRDSRDQIEQLGIQLGFNVRRRLNSDIVWKEPGKVPYLFRFTSTALLASNLMQTTHLRTSERRCLVLPGGRAALVALKMRRDPRLLQAVERDNWVFIKFRHLRRMLTEITHRGEIDFYLGLDPIVEMDTAQIPLPLN
jgi:hypothetical protein